MKDLLRCIALLPLRPPLFTAILQVFRLAHFLPAKAPDRTNPPKHVLVVNLTDFVGDTVMMMPLLDRLHTAVPGAIIDVVTSGAMAGFVRELPYLNQVYGFRIRTSRIPIWKQYRKLVHMACFVHAEMNERSYDLCLLPRWGSDPEMSPFFASMTSAPRTIGHDSRDEVGSRDPIPGVRHLLTCVSRGGAGLPEAIRELRLLEACGIVEHLDVAAEEARSIDGLVQIAERISLPTLKTRLDIADVPFMVLAPGASEPGRRWPPERFAEIAISLHQRLGFQVLIIGGVAEKAIGKQIEDQVGTSACNLIGRTNLAETVALLSEAALLLANDSGPGHLGAGLGVPTIVLSASPLTCTREVGSSPLRVRPVGPAVRVLQPYHPADGCIDRCVEQTAHCILGITVESVLNQAELLLNR